MGHGNYSVTNSVMRSTSYQTKSLDEIFQRETIDNAMNPYNVLLRESRDSADHPNSFPIILAMDETGSMGRVPEYLVKKGFTHLMNTVINNGEADPQILFMGIGDHFTDSAPLQIGQFESSDELLDRWLTNVFIEGKGGGNGGESYSLAWYFAGYRTSTDSFEKRGRKGLLFTVGDEPVHDLDLKAVESVCGRNGDVARNQLTAENLLKKARETYEVFHIHVREGTNGKTHSVMNGWKKLMGENLIIVDSAEDVPQAIADTVVRFKGTSVTSAESAGSTDEVL